MAENLHDDELPIDAELVRALVARTLPERRGQPLRQLQASGSTNALFRLGDDLLVRLPRQPGGTATIEKEARWTPMVAEHLPVSVPEVVAVGEPGHGYPERWSVVCWIDGEPPAVVDRPSRDLDLDGLADDLTGVLTALHGIDVPAEALRDPAVRWYRGDPLGDRDTRVRADVEACRSLAGLDVDLDRVLEVWENAMALPGAHETATPPRWYHGDLFAENLVVRDGRLVAVLDFGGLGVGDPTVDLLPAWEILDAPARARLHDALPVDDTTWLAGRAWALALAVMTFPYYWTTMPQRCASRLAIARAVLADAHEHG